MASHKGRRVAPIRPRALDWQRYNRRIYRLIVAPYFADVAQAMGAAASSYEELRTLLRGVRAQLDDDLLSDAVRKQLTETADWHRDRFRRTMASAFGVDVRPLMHDMGVQTALTTALRRNVSLIKTIPPRFHQALTRDLEALARSKPFDRHALSTVLAKRYKSSGYNLRRLTRDQTSKFVGQLSHARQVQVGIERYEWITAGDERVRTEHQLLNGEVFAWHHPPPEGHPGEAIQCRCVPAAIVTPEHRQHVRAQVSGVTAPKASVPIRRYHPVPAGMPRAAAPPTGTPPVPKPPQPAPPPAPPPVASTTPGPVAPIVQGLRLQEASEQGRERLRKELLIGNATAARPTDAQLHALVAKEFGTENYVQLAQDTMGSDRVAIYMAISASKLNRVVASGEFRNVAQTGRGAFAKAADERIDSERNIFGIADNVSPADLPKYGFVAGRDEMDWENIVGWGYGENFVRFKPGVRPQTTITASDSLAGNNLHAAPPVPINKIDETFFWGHISGDGKQLIGRSEHWGGAEYRLKKSKALRDKNYRALMAKDYVEAQMHGSIPLHMVEAIEVQSVRYAAKLRKALDKAGHPDIKVVAGKYDDRLKGLWAGEREIMDRLNPADIDALGDAYIDEMFKWTANVFGDRHARVKWPPEIKTLREDLISKLPYGFNRHDDIYLMASKTTPEEKRAWVTTWWRTKAKREKSGLPIEFWENYKPATTGFTDDVMNKELLEAYPQ